MKLSRHIAHSLAILAQAILAEASGLPSPCAFPCEIAMEMLPVADATGDHGLRLALRWCRKPKCSLSWRAGSTRFKMLELVVSVHLMVVPDMQNWMLFA